MKMSVETNCIEHDHSDDNFNGASGSFAAKLAGISEVTTTMINRTTVMASRRQTKGRQSLRQKRGVKILCQSEYATTQDAFNEPWERLDVL
jgi:hypothetical protein